MSSALPPEHPDDDLLADLAADVLPTHQARLVEAHVMECRRCSAVLTDAEQVRNLLLRDEPGPMPDDVFARIDAALQIELAARDGIAEYPAPTSPHPVSEHVPPVQPPAEPPRRNTTQAVKVVTPWDDTMTIEAYESARKRQKSVRSGPREPGPATTTTGISAPGRGPRPGRPSRGPSLSRKDLRAEVRDLRAGRRGFVLAGAAGVVVLLGLGAFVVTGLLSSHESESLGTTASVEAVGKPSGGTAGGPPVLTTGTDYTGTALAQQARALVSRTTTPGGRGLSPQMQESGVHGATATPGPSAAAPGATGDLQLRNPAALQGCLQALQAQGQRPVAVDLARYEGREAAIIVLNGRNGGYEVWAVARDCRPGADGTIKYLALTN